MIARFADWLGRARSINDDITSDALRIASLKLALSANRRALERANEKLDAWQAKWDAALPDIAYARKRKASLAAYEKKRGCK